MSYTATTSGGYAPTTYSASTAPASTTGGGGFGNMMFGSAATGSSGLFGAGGQYNAGQTMYTTGMGMGIAQAFAGRSATGATISGRVNFSQHGKRLELDVLNQAKAELSGENLAQPFVKSYISIQKGRLKRQAAETKKQTKRTLAAASSREIQTGAGMRGALAGTAGDIEGMAAPERWGADFGQQEYRKGLTGLQNIRNIELQTPLLQASARFAQAETAQMRGAQQGQALGDMAMYYAYLRNQPSQR